MIKEIDVKEFIEKALSKSSLLEDRNFVAKASRKNKFLIANLKGLITSIKTNVKFRNIYFKHKDHYNKLIETVEEIENDNSIINEEAIENIDFQASIKQSLSKKKRN